MIVYVYFPLTKFKIIISPTQGRGEGALGKEGLLPSPPGVIYFYVDKFKKFLTLYNLFTASLDSSHTLNGELNNFYCIFNINFNCD